MTALAPFLLPLVLVFGYVLGIFALVSSWRSSLAGHRFGRLLAVPLVASALLIVGLAVRYPGDSWLLIP